MGKLNAATFARFLEERAAAKDGYIMGARGQDPKKWRVNSWWFTQYSGARRAKALYWRKNAERVWDCQGLSEGYINQETGSNIDIRARNNYANWCSPKGKGSIPVKYRLPGAAVFSGWPISHVGYLVRPIDPANPAGDWYVVEAKGVMYGVVTTRLSRGRWSRWGLMTKYFSYEAVPTPETPLEIGARTLRKGMSGDDVRELQSMLIELDYDLGRWGADGDFGSATEKAVKAYQKNNRLAVDGIAGPLTIGALLDVFAHEETEDEETGPEEPEPEAPEQTEPPKPAKEYAVHALDLSEHNAAKFSEIDWAGIRDNVGFLILRAGITREKTAPRGIGPDKYFDRYAEKCREHGIPFWAYYYSRGSTMEQARAEADYLFKTASPCGPVGYALDCEVKGIKVGAFFGRLIELGAKRTMIYIGHNWYPIYDLPVGEDGHIQCCDADWIPRYGKNDGTAKEKYRPAYPCDLWQYTSKFACDWIPDKTLDCNKLNGRRSMAWFRGEE
jgi:GH25 family lysozyme M1 (1,4-beta-N-acetylmuramidase)